MVHEPHEPHEQAQGLLLADEVYRIQGAVFEVNRELGAGFLESVYQESLALEFSARGIPFAAQPRLNIAYKGVSLRSTFVPDFICFGQVLVELKALSAIAPEHRAQVLNNLKATRLRVALLVNFGQPSRAQVQRIAL